MPITSSRGGRRSPLISPFQDFGAAPASVDDVAQNHTATVLAVGGRYRFKLWGAPATLRVQVQNATNFYIWNLGYTGFSEFQPRSYFALDRGILPIPSRAPILAI
jgi:hypothetical protein